MKTDDDAIYFVSFLDGLQRVLLFTDDFKTAYCASQVLKLRFPHGKTMQNWVLQRLQLMSIVDSI